MPKLQHSHEQNTGAPTGDKTRGARKTSPKDAGDAQRGTEPLCEQAIRRHPSCSPEEVSLPCYLPQSQGWDGKKRQKAAERTPALSSRAQQKPHSTAATFLPRCDAKIAPSPESSSCSPDTSNH